MKRDEFLAAIRHEGAKFRADNITISSGEMRLAGKGHLEIAGGRFRVFVTLGAESSHPALVRGIVSRSDFWLIKGLIEDEVGFSMRDLPSNSRLNQTFGERERVTLEFSSNSMELAPRGFDNLTAQEIYKLQKQANPEPQVEPLGRENRVSEAESKPGAGTGASQNEQATFVAVVPRFKLVEHNATTQTTRKNIFLGESSSFASDTFHGEIAGWSFGLVERDGDLHVYLTSKDGRQSSGVENDQQLFNAFLNAVAFAHGKHTWPFSFEYRRNGKLILDRVQLNDDLADSPHAPFNEALAFYNVTKQMPWQFAEVLDKAFGFFGSDSRLARESENILYIFREATARGVPKRISLLTLCSLMESLVRVIYEEQIAATIATETSEFLKIKTEVCEEFNKKEHPAYQRLSAILVNAESVNMRMRFDAVIAHLGLKKVGKMAELHDQWRKFRNPISHRMSKSSESDESRKEELLGESRIAGAINCVILKLMGYSGYVRLSAYEDIYGQI